MLIMSSSKGNFPLNIAIGGRQHRFRKFPLNHHHVLISNGFGCRNGHGIWHAACSCHMLPQPTFCTTFLDQFFYLYALLRPIVNNNLLPIAAGTSSRGTNRRRFDFILDKYHISINLKHSLPE